MLSEEETAIGQREKVRYRFLDAASDVVAVGDRLAPGDGLPAVPAGKVRELHPDFDLLPAQDTIRRFCDSRGTHVEVEPLGRLNVVLALRPVHLENGTGADIVTFAVTPVPSPTVVREYPRLLTAVIMVSLLWAGLGVPLDPREPPTAARSRQARRHRRPDGCTPPRELLQRTSSSRSSRRSRPRPRSASRFSISTT